MAKAVEDSAAVLICVSKRYKESQACRTEAEYAFQQRKKIIPGEGGRGGAARPGLSRGRATRLAAPIGREL